MNSAARVYLAPLTSSPSPSNDEQPIGYRPLPSLESTKKHIDSDGGNNKKSEVGEVEKKEEKKDDDDDEEEEVVDTDEIKEFAEEQLEGEGVEATAGFSENTSGMLESTSAAKKVSNSLIEVLSIAINFLQTFSLVIFIDVNWPYSFKLCFRWVRFFLFDFGWTFGISSEAPSVMLGLCICPILICTLDHGASRAIQRRRRYREGGGGGGGELKAEREENDLGSKILSVGENEERAIIRMIFLTTLLIFIWAIAGMIIPTIMLVVASVGFAANAHKDYPKVAKMKMLSSALAAFTKMLKNLKIIERLPTGKLVWISFWILAFSFVVSGWVADVTVVVVSMWIPLALGSVVNQTRLSYLKRYLKGSCDHTKMNFSHVRKRKEQVFFLFSISLFYLSGIYSCLDILRYGKGDGDEDLVFFNMTNATNSSVFHNSTSDKDSRVGLSSPLRTIVRLVGFLLLLVYLFVPLVIMTYSAWEVRKNIPGGETTYAEELQKVEKTFRIEANLADEEEGSEKLITAEELDSSYKVAVISIFLSSFKPSFWWWKIVLLLERGLLAGIILLEWDSWLAVGITGLGWLGCLFAQPYWSFEETRADIVARSTTLLTVFAGTMIGKGYLVGDEIWLAICLNVATAMTIILLVKEIDPQRLYRSFVHFLHQLKRNHLMHSGKVGAMHDEDMGDMTLEEFAAEPDEIKTKLTVKFPSHPAISSYWLKEYDIGHHMRIDKDELEVILECAKEMNSGDAMVYMTLTKRLITVVNSHVMEITWVKMGLRGVLPDILVEKLLRLVNLNLEGNEVTFDDTEVLMKKKLHIDKIGLGLTHEINNVIALAEAIGKDRAFAIESILEGSFAKSVVVREGKVVEIWWGDQNISASIPPILGSLTSLEKIVLDRNHLFGPIPDEIGWLTSLELLDLRTNKLGGEIPAAIGWLTSLVECHLNDNNFKGKVPYEFVTLSNTGTLRILDLSDNIFLDMTSVPKELEDMNKKRKSTRSKDGFILEHRFQI